MKTVYKIHGSTKNIITEENTEYSLVATIQALASNLIMLKFGKISSEDEFPYTLEEFISKIVPVYRKE